ncbi:hypothetical protein N7451_012237 [Penicillium sp. IBT 35674x]|nr:hypothetical protein N7451_012237 [Penicillium sp. IBT 35674x]
MSLESNDRAKVDRVLERDPNVTIFLRPIAAPAAFGRRPRSILAWWRVTVYLLEEAFGQGSILKFFPIFRTPLERPGHSWFWDSESRV